MLNKDIHKSVVGKSIAIYGEKFLIEQTEADLIRIRNLIAEVNSMGYFVEYLEQLQAMDKNDRCLIPVIVKYIGTFHNFRINEYLYAALSVKGFIEVTEFLICEFRKPNNQPIKLPDIAWNLTRRARASSAIFNIADKNHADDYIELVKNPNTREDCPFIINLLGCIKCEEAHNLLVELLNVNNISIQSSALQSLGKFKNHPEVISLIEPFTRSEDSALRTSAKQSITKLRKGLSK